MADEAIEKIFETLTQIRRLVQEKDPSQLHWGLRITAVYRIFRAFDAFRFRLEPADPPQVLSDLLELLRHLESTPAGTDNGASPVALAASQAATMDDPSQRMQFLYGLAWAQLSREDYYDAADLLARRLRNSNLDISFFQGARCLDLGTGIARWAVAMVQLGASHVTGIDFSAECLEEARCRLARVREAERVTLVHGDLYRLPGSMEAAFDFVCANGVIHHLPDPGGGLEVMARCTRPGGKAFVFVFARNDAPWWPAVELMRELAAPVPISYAHRLLKFYEVPGAKVFNTLDYSYTPIQHKLDRDWVEATLRQVGFRDLHMLEGGVIHDSVLRCRLFETDRRLYGISEIRYLLTK